MINNTNNINRSGMVVPFNQQQQPFNHNNSYQQNGNIKINNPKSNIPNIKTLKEKD